MRRANTPAGLSGCASRCHSCSRRFTVAVQDAGDFRSQNSSRTVFSAVRVETPLVRRGPQLRGQMAPHCPQPHLDGVVRLVPLCSARSCTGGVAGTRHTGAVDSAAWTSAPPRGARLQRQGGARLPPPAA